MHKNGYTGPVKHLSWLCLSDDGHKCARLFITIKLQNTKTCRLALDKRENRPFEEEKEVFYSVAFYEKTESKPSIENVQRDTLSERKVARTLTTCQSKLSLSPDELTSKNHSFYGTHRYYSYPGEKERAMQRRPIVVFFWCGSSTLVTCTLTHRTSTTPYHILKLIYLTRTIVETPKMNCNNNNHKIKMTMMVMIKRAN